ncbi:pilus assembly FimT family protein [Kiritimatiella glycovorans]|uniref:Tfp pilus assembly protein FimT n=1 Tax=Kiritimatiella glycovorans TaxID=1307763 RepID=A0A0G3EAQ7_9BACT|nr:prepilin-type N-terminal cleavage/methylation domain-containing protein [Kiritimatiella glycovorans]AKJ63566.1 Tfp pilus assembly protein FimT [Kiritimatiella glycovorans]
MNSVRDTHTRRSSAHIDCVHQRSGPAGKSGERILGFTLPEVLCVLLILSVLVYMALPVFPSWTASRSVGAALAELRAGLNLARRTAINGRCCAFLVLAPGSDRGEDRWSVFKGEAESAAERAVTGWRPLPPRVRFDVTDDAEGRTRTGSVFGYPARCAVPGLDRERVPCLIFDRRGRLAHPDFDARIYIRAGRAAGRGRGFIRIRRATGTAEVYRPREDET